MTFCMPSELISLLECLDVKKLPMEWTFVRRSREYKLIMSWKYPGKKPVVVRKSKKTPRKVPPPISGSTKRSSTVKLLSSSPKEQENDDEDVSDEDTESDDEDTASASSDGLNNQSASPNVDGLDRERPDSSETGSVIPNASTSIKNKSTKEKQAIPINLKDKQAFDEWYKNTTGKKPFTKPVV